MSKHRYKDSNQSSSSSNNDKNNNPPKRETKKHSQPVAEPEITKLDYAVANYMKNSLPIKWAVFVGIKRVNYFIGSKAVDLLMESKWANNQQGDAIFKTRNDVVLFLNDLLLKKFYHRSRKIVRMDGTKRKFKLDMHDVQVFEDSNEPYIWLYEPTSLKAWLCCIGVIVVVILICLFPLWPSSFRTGVYYICIAGLVFLSTILFLALLRHVVFFALWTLTFGKLHFWILPNLTEDVGFLESFWPLYTIEKGDNIMAGEAIGPESSSSNGGETGSVRADASVPSHSHQD